MSAATFEVIDGMPFDEYQKAPGLSSSALDDFVVSPLRYWHLHRNPDREPEEPSRALVFGQALHTAILEPAEFEKRYYRELELPEGTLCTVEDLNGWLKSRDVKPGKLKKDLIRQVHEIDPTVPIADVLAAEHAKANEGKTLFTAETWERVETAARALRNEPQMEHLLSQPGKRELSIFATDPKTGLRLKIRPDFFAEKFILDPKTITAGEGYGFDESVTRAIWNFRYRQRAYFYSLVASIVDGKGERAPMKDCRDYVFAFVESAPPHEVRIRTFRPTVQGQLLMAWENARVEVEGMLERFATCERHFGDRPWRQRAFIDPLVDEDFKQLAWSA